MRAEPPRRVYFNSLEELYPAGPARDLLREHCIGCHRDDFGTMHYTKEAFVRGIEKMTETGPANNHYSLALGRTPISKPQKAMLAEYLAKHFGPGLPDKKLKVDPLVFDEAVASKAIYVSYDIPDDLPFPSMGNQIGGNMVDGVIPQLAPETRHHLQAAAISPVDGRVWYSSRASSSVLGLDPKQLDPAKRWDNHPIKGEPYVHPTGIAVDKQGRVYWAEARGSRLGELDPVTRKQIRYALPAQAGAMLQVVVDKDQNIDFSIIWGAFFGKMEATSRKLHMYPTPTPDNGIYGLDVDREGNMWGAGLAEGHHQQVGREDRSGDRIQGAERVGTDSPHLRGLEGHRLGLGVQHRNPGQARPGHGQDDRLQDPGGGRAALRRVAGQVGQHLDGRSRAQRHREAGSACEPMDVLPDASTEPEPAQVRGGGRQHAVVRQPRRPGHRRGALLPERLHAGESAVAVSVDWRTRGGAGMLSDERRLEILDELSGRDWCAADDLADRACVFSWRTRPSRRHARSPPVGHEPVRHAARLHPCLACSSEAPTYSTGLPSTSENTLANSSNVVVSPVNSWSCRRAGPDRAARVRRPRRCRARR